MAEFQITNELQKMQFLWRYSLTDCCAIVYILSIIFATCTCHWL